MKEKPQGTTRRQFGGSVQRFVRRLRWLNPMRHWRQRLRNIDHAILFREIRRLSEEVNTDASKVAAANAILWHCANDHAWMYPDEYSKRDTEILPQNPVLLCRGGLRPGQTLPQIPGPDLRRRTASLLPPPHPGKESGPRHRHHRSVRHQVLFPKHPPA